MNHNCPFREVTGPISSDDRGSDDRGSDDLFFPPTGMAAAVVTAARDDRGHDDRGLGHPGDDLELKQNCQSLQLNYKECK